MLLYKQAEVANLEEQLKDIDDEDDVELGLGNWRRDQNKGRKRVLKDLDKKLAAYGIVYHPQLGYIKVF